MELLTAFLGGLLASLSPCTYPLIPITLSFLGAAKNSKPVVWFTVGKIISLLILGLFAVQSGAVLGELSQSAHVQIIVGSFLIYFSVYGLLGKVPFVLEKLHGLSHRFEGNAFLLGAGSALLVSPCTTPILYSVLMIVATHPSKLYGISVMLAYAVGFSVLLFAVGIGAVKKLPRSGGWMKHFQRLSNVTLLLLGFYYIYLGVNLL